MMLELLASHPKETIGGILILIPIIGLAIHELNTPPRRASGRDTFDLNPAQRRMIAKDLAADRPFDPTLGSGDLRRAKRIGRY